MFGEHSTEVLVVGAGPVGLISALFLSQQGVQVEVIDKEEQTTARSYACALHPGSLEILGRLGLLEDVLQRGYRIDTVAFYEGASRRGEVQLSKLPVQHPFVVVLPQSELERLLEQKLRDRSRVNVGWNERLSGLHLERDRAVATIHKLGEACTGYLVSELELLVVKTLRTNAAFVIGADGHNSPVRDAQGISYDAVGETEFFAVHEFETDGTIEPEVRIALEANRTSVCWPLSEHRCRWTCQVTREEIAEERQSKQRTPVWLEQEAFDPQTLRHVEEFVRRRAPWFHTAIDELDWSAAIQCERRLVASFGQGRCWLAGDAAHRTGPVGMQSMNVGLREAEELADTVAKILRGQASFDALEAYNRDRRSEWGQLLALRGAELTATGQAAEWARQHAARILPCLPASGNDLSALVQQLGLALR